MTTFRNFAEYWKTKSCFLFFEKNGKWGLPFFPFYQYIMKAKQQKYNNHLFFSDRFELAQFELHISIFYKHSKCGFRIKNWHSRCRDYQTRQTLLFWNRDSIKTDGRVVTNKSVSNSFIFIKISPHYLFWLEKSNIFADILQNRRNMARACPLWE